MSKNALLMAKEAADKGSWKEVYEICQDYLDADDLDSWDILECEEEIEIRLLRIECLIYGISLQDFFSGEYDGKKMLCTDVYASIVDMLGETIDGMVPYLTAEDDAETKNNIEGIYDRIATIAQDHYYDLLDDRVNSISADVRDGSYNNFVAYFNGYNCLFNNIVWNFAGIDMFLENLSLKCSDSTWKEAQRVTRDKLFEKALEITNLIDGLSTDFPYFGDKEAAYMYMRAICVTEMSIPSRKDAVGSEKNNRIQRLKHQVNLCCDFLNAIYVINGQRVSLCIAEKERERQYNGMLQCVNEIKEYEPGYMQPDVRREKFSTLNSNAANSNTAKKSGGCYVATAVYGSYDCPEVWTLRRYRDTTLAETWYGRTFIKTYYAISPTLVKWFGHTEWFKNMWKGKLDRMVEKLQANGVESTPYEDRNW